MTGDDKELIDRLVAGLRPVPRRGVERRLQAGLALGVAGAGAVMLPVLGPRHDWLAMLGSQAFAIKLAYAGALALAGLGMLGRLARPMDQPIREIRVLPMILGLMAAVAALSLFLAPASSRGAMILGSTARVCPLLIALISLPVLAALLVALRGLAPTRPGAAGAAAGLLAGAAGSFVYAFHCPESGLPFVALWYTAGILLSTAIGAIFGRLFLRWR